MSKVIVQTGQFKGLRKQPLHNVLIYAPTIIWVTHGHKQLWWHDTTLNFHSADWLMLPANQYLTFVNVPQQAQFYSRTLTLHEAPPVEWITQSSQYERNEQPRVRVTAALAYCFELLYEMNQQSLSEETQRQFVLGFYAQLQELRPLMEVAVACGYQSLTRFSARFKQQYRLTPYQYLQTITDKPEK
ncbi:helix-turn-helix domain-containing protein [Vibrio cholerae]|uniref:helix-turn-helix domain-containing protein n=1 Tax=Vibrio cholerae TaxID=666 RepID=UPI00019F74A3|nr:helix-turn-helix domain-containing protein [Vibrio cholerae]EEO07582.1 transcriptional regulator AraC/XylS family [Vibrio cholerae TM 11079-80]EMP87687.1 bacterial regulatory helix-turn-helix s, AraC family protein [Vibrio cholerae O1 str. 116063]OFJ10198.1 hypothetical protein BFX28_05370 [Vibrio cholerae]GIA05411.1 transcriptional regulator, AraC/XylS family [Vibrio cholerae]HAS5639749.1 AraC family transcriptional regulator [Vibrio cholerae]